MTYMRMIPCLNSSDSTIFLSTPGSNLQRNKRGSYHDRYHRSPRPRPVLRLASRVHRRSPEAAPGVPPSPSLHGILRLWNSKPSRAGSNPALLHLEGRPALDDRALAKPEPL